MIHSIGTFAQNHLLNLRGKKIERKVIVFESDDWGSIRIPSLEAYKRLTARGIDLSKNPYNRFDSLESADDLHALFELITAFKDHRNNHPIITTNFIVANPDFDKIKESRYSNYYFESFTETYERNKPTEVCASLIHQGVSDNLIRPQLHGREHLNALYWLRLLRDHHPMMLAAFDEGVFSIDIDSKSAKRDNLMATLDYTTLEEKKFAYKQLGEGADLFKQVFGFVSKSFIAPCNVWDEGAEEVLSKNGVTYIQSLRGQKIPQPSGYETRLLLTGGRSLQNQVYTVRNAYFEPSTDASYDWIGNCLAKIRAAFFWGKPAIISMHRLNFIGTIIESNRTKNLIMFQKLLSEILKQWPEVEFMSSDQLGLLYEQK